MILKHKSYNVNGIDYHLVENKAEHAKADLIFLHGICGNYREFLPLMRLIYKDYNFVAIDLPGFGRSEALKTFSVDRLILDLSEIIEFMKFKKPVMVGHSLGGDVGYLLASKGAKINKLIVFNSPILGTHIPKPSVDYLAALAKLPANSPLVDVITALKNSKLGADFIDKIVSNYLDKGVKTLNQAYNYNYAAEAVGEANANAAIEYCKFLLNLDLTVAIKNISIPALCFFGMDDLNVSVSTQKYLTEIKPQFQTVMLENFDHGGIIFKPERVIDYLNKFI